MQREARLAGVAYLATIIAGLFAEVYARGSIWAAGDPAATAANLQAFAPLYRSSILADCVMFGAYLVVTALFYRLFKPASAPTSLIAAFFSLAGIALLLAATIVLTLPLQQPESSYAALRLHGAAYNLTGLFFGPYCMLIGWLVLRSGLVPRAIGFLMALAGATFVLDAALTLVAPQVANQVPDAVLLVSLIGEGSLAIWLSLFGIRRSTEEKLHVSRR